MTPEPCPCGQPHDPSPAARAMYHLGKKIQMAGSVDDLGPMIVAALDEVERAAVAEEREQCCRDVCDRCRDDVPLEMIGGVLTHYTAHEGTRTCHAWAIRARAQAHDVCTCATVTGAHRADCPACPPEYWQAPDAGKAGGQA